MALTDLQAAAVVWRHQIERFHDMLTAAKAGAASLDFRTLLDDPARALKAASRHLRLDIADDTLEATAHGEIFSRNSKFADKKFDSAQRGAEEVALVERWKPELDLIMRWARTLNLGVDAALPLPKPLPG